MTKLFNALHCSSLCQYRSTTLEESTLFFNVLIEGSTGCIYGIIILFQLQGSTVAHGMLMVRYRQCHLLIC